MKLSGLFALLMLSAPAFAANDIDRSFVARYGAQAEGMDAGVLSISVKATDAGFRMNSVMEPSSTALALGGGRLSQSSFFEIRKGNVIPRHFKEVREGAKATTWSLGFDWNAMTVQIDPGESIKIPRSPVDRNTVLIQAMLTPPSPSRDLKVSMVSKSGVRGFSFKEMGEHQLDTPLGMLTTHRIRQFKKGSPEGKYLDIWLAPDLGFVPVRFERHKRGRVVTLSILSLEDG